MLRNIVGLMSEVSAIVFAIYLGYFFYQDPEFQPGPYEAVKTVFEFCAICAVYWWFQSGSLALSGVKTAIGMATDIIASFAPLLVVGYVIGDVWRGNLVLSEFKTYASWYALGIVLLDITFNSMIMARLSRRYLGEVQ